MELRQNYEKLQISLPASLNQVALLMFLTYKIQT